MAKELSLIAKGAGLYFAGFAVSKLLSYLYRAMLARGLGPDSFGIFSIGMSVTGIILVFAALGLYQGILHFATIYDSLGKPEKARGTILLGFKAQFAASIVLALALFLSSDYIAISLFREPELAIVLKILSIALPFTVLASGLMVVALAFKKIKYKIYVRNLIENIVKISATAVFLLFGFHLFGAALGLALSSVVAFLVGLYFVQKKIFPLFGKNLKTESNLGELFSYSWPLLAVGFFDIIMYSIDTVMLGYLSKAYDAGLYSVAQPTANLLNIAPFAFGSLFLPVVTGLYAQKKLKDLNKTFKVVSRWIFAAIFPGLLFTIIFAGEILAVMFGDVYAKGASALAILALGIFMVSFVGPVRSILESVKKTKLIFFNTVLAGTLNIALNIWLIPLFGATGNAIIGAALATAGSYIVWNILGLAEVFAITKMHPYSRAYIAPTIAACIAAGLFLLALPSIPMPNSFSFPLSVASLIAYGAVFVVLYAMAFLLLKGFEAEDIEIIKKIEAKTGLKIGPARQLVKRFI